MRATTTSLRANLDFVYVRRWKFGALALTLLAFSGCTLIDLSGLSTQSTSSGMGGASSKSTSDSSTATSSNSTGGGGGGGPAPMIHRLYVLGGRLQPSTPTNTIFVTTIGDDGALGPFDSVVQTMGAAREEFSLAYIDSHLFVVGGTGFDGSQTVVDNDSTLIGTVAQDGTVGGWVTASATLPAKLARTGVATLENHLFIAGGRPEFGSTQSNLIVRADELNGDIPSFQTAATLPSPNSNVGVAIIDGNIVIVGGSANTTKTWHASIVGSGALGPVTNGPSLNVGRQSHCTVGGVVGSASRIYVVGGEATTYLDSIEVLSSNGGTLGTWQPSGLKLASGRRNLACALYGNWLYVIGGVLQSQEAATDITRFDLDPTSGLPLAMHDETPLPEGRAFHQAAIVDLPKP